MRWNERRNAILDWGHGPTHIEVVSGTVEIAGLAPRSVTLTPLSAAGAPLSRPVPVRLEQDRVSCSLGEVPALLYLLQIAR